MQIKIKTKDIELEYSDECTIIEEYAKNRILEIINQIYQDQVALNENTKQMSYKVFEAMKK